MTKYIIAVTFLFTVFITSGQTIIKSPIFQSEADNLQRSLNRPSADTTRIEALLRLAEFNFQKLGDELSDLDSADRFIKTAKEINSRQLSRKRDGIILLYETYLLRARGNRDSAKHLAKKAIALLQAWNNDTCLILTYLELSRCYDSDKPDEATEIKNVYNTLFQRVPKQISKDQLYVCLLELFTFYVLKMKTENYIIRVDFLEHLAETYRIENDKVNEFWARKEIADVHHMQGKLTQAIDELLQIAKEQKAGGYPRICFTYDLLSGLYYVAVNYDKALHYSLETIKNVSTSLDSAYLSNFYARVATNYSVTGSTAEAVNWNLKRLNYLISVKKTGAIFGIIFNITSDMIKLGRTEEALSLILRKKNDFVPSDNWEKRCLLLSLAQCYAALQERKIAEKYCEEVIKINELRIRQKETPVDIGINQFFALFYLDLRQFEKAEKYFRTSMDDQHTGGRSTSTLFQNNFLFKLDSAKGNYVSAIKHLQALQTAKDSIFTETKIKQIEQVKIGYETDQKDQQIAFNRQNIQLLTKQDLLQKSKIRQGAALRNIGFVVVGLLIVVMALLYNRYRLKQRTNISLQLQQNEIAKQNVFLNHLVNEKDWLVKEIHHRVKNNLQIVMSLLNSQSAYIENGPALTAIQDSQHRVHAMSLIHQKLYGSANVSTIDMAIYIRELVAYLRDSFNTGQRIQFEYNIIPLELDVSHAVPLGLILNEAITNSIKYAFPENREGTITISLSNTAHNQYFLTIADNGMGMPAHFVGKKPGSLGMSLMAGLSEDLGGSFTIKNDNGTVITISFVQDLTIKRAELLTSSPITSN